jgi:hypothetical protein
MKLVTAPVGAGFDCSVYCGPEAAAAMKAHGYRYIARYVRRDKHVNDGPDPDWPVSLSRQELRELLEAELLVSPVQFARFHGRNYLSADSGAAIGEAAAWNCQQLGLPEGTTVWVDAEWTDGPDPDLVLAYLRAWAEPVAAAGYRPGVYVGWEGLTGAQWYGLPKFQAYWRAGMRYLSAPLPRSYCMFQSPELKGDDAVLGLDVDTDFVTYDEKKARPYMVGGGA